MDKWSAFIQKKSSGGNTEDRAVPAGVTCTYAQAGVRLRTVDG
jgi:hypothetical protein